MAVPLIVASLVVTAVSAVYSGVQQSNALKAQSKQAKLNAIAARQQSNANEETLRRENRMRQGRLRAAAAESGFDPNSGSLLDLQVKSGAEMELDVLNERYNGELSAIGMQNQASGLRSQASAARTSGYLNAAGALLSGASYFGGGSSYNYRGSTLPNSLRGGG